MAYFWPLLILWEAIQAVRKGDWREIEVVRDFQDSDGSLDKKLRPITASIIIWALIVYFTIWAIVD